MNYEQRQPELARLLELERLCSEFEEGFSAENRPQLEDYLAKATNLDTEEAFCHLLDVELEQAERHNRPVDRKDYLARFQGFANIVHAAFSEREEFRRTPDWSSTGGDDDGPRAPGSHRRESPDTWKLQPGTMLADRFKIISLVGKGGMGEVYRAEDVVLNQCMAVKLLPAALADQAKRRDYFLNEARLARQVSHPNVCRVHDVGEHDGQLFLTMEYVDGEDLQALLRRVGRLPFDRGLELATQLTAGLAAAHEKGVIHRDLKPTNILVDEWGRPRIADFGLAALARQLADSNSIVGTPGYMAPETLRGESANESSDIYSLGLILSDVFGIESGQKGETGQLPAGEDSSLQDGLGRIISKAAAVDAARRYRQVTDLQADLRSVAGEAGATAPRVRSVVSRFGTKTKIACGALAIGVALLLAMTLRFEKDTARSLVDAMQVGPNVTVAADSESRNGIGWPVLAPNGEGLAYVATDESGRRNVFFQQLLESPKAERLTSSDGHSSTVWMPDGKRIAFLRFEGPGLYAPQRAQIVTIRRDGLDEQLIYPPPEQKEGFPTIPAVYHSLDCQRSSRGLHFLFSKSTESAGAQLTLLTNRNEDWQSVAWREQALTSGEWTDYGGRISPDGESVAFIRKMHGSEAIFVLPLDGTGQPRCIHADQEWILNIGWMTNRHVVFSSEMSGLRELHVVDALQPGATPRLPFGLAAIGLDIRGNRCVYVASEGRFRLWRMDKKNGQWDRKLFLPHHASQSSAYLTEDASGKLIALFTRRLNGKRTILSWSEDAGDQPIPLTIALDGHSGSPRSIDGDVILFDSRLEDTNFRSAIYSVHRRSKKLTRITSGQHEIRPNWSRDGESIYFASNRSGKFHVYRVRADGTDERRMTAERDGGKFIAAQEGPGMLYLAGESSGIWQVPIDNDVQQEAAAPLSAATAKATTFVVRGDLLYYFDHDANQFREHDVATGRDTLVATLDAPTSALSWFGISEDATTILYADYEQGPSVLHHREFVLPAHLAIIDDGT